MQTVQNISNSFGYMKCGEILKSQPNYQDPYILRCIQCHEIYLLLESFILHFEDECKIASSTKKLIHGAKTFKEEKTENIIHEVENRSVKLESNNRMLIEDPLIVVKNEADDESSIFEEDSKLQESGRSDLFENPEVHKFSMVTECHTQDEDGDTAVYTQDENESEDSESEKAQCIKKSSTSNNASSSFVSSFMKSPTHVTALIAAYKDQPQLWNKNMPFYSNKLKRREFMEQIAEDLNNEHKLNLTGSQVSAVVVHLCRKYQEDLQRVQEKDDNEDKTKKQYYVSPWFLKQLEFIKPYLENYSLEILDSNLVNLMPQQILQILEIYRGCSNLWNSNLIEFHCKNKRHETLIEMLKSIETNMNLKITEKILEEYIRTIHNYFIKEKRKILNNKKDRGSTTETSASEYYAHLMFLYDHVRPFRCSVCGGEYINPLHFKMHKSNHDGTVPFTCSQCNKTFKRVNVYISHAKRHLEDLNHVCKECGKKFITFTNLRLHMRIHTGDKPYCCEMCGESFRFLQTLSNHRRRHEKRYLHSCKICSQGFYSKLRHDDHMNSHLNIRSYICDVCSKAFITKRALQQHKVVHEDVRKHSCKLCGKTFKHRAGVNQHMKTHDIATINDKSYVQL